MNNGYLIPANSKKSLLHFNAFTTLDLIIFGSGVGATIILCLVLPLTSILMTIIALAPALVCGFLVIPVPNYHNIRTFLTSMYVFYTTNQEFRWRGWCVLDEESRKK